MATKVAIVTGLGRNICHSSPTRDRPRILSHHPGHRGSHRPSDITSQAWPSIKVPHMKDRIATATAEGKHSFI